MTPQEQLNQEQAEWAASLPKPPTLGCDEMTARLVAAGIPADRIRLHDDDYRMLSPADVTDKLSSALESALFSLGIKYEPDLFDCNAFAGFACQIARLAHAVKERKKPQPEQSAPAIGVMTGSMHAYCVAVHNEGVKFYEPQPSVPEGEAVFAPKCLREIFPSRDELAICDLCIFI